MPILRRTPFALSHRLSCAYHSTASNGSKLTIGIRREDPRRIWERRCPISPDAVHELVEKEGVEVLIQDCERRVWSTNEFVKAGARIHPTLSPSHITLGIKETPLHEVLTDPVPAIHEAPSQSPQIPRTHLMFSHTVKGQPYNMELLSKFLHSDPPHPGVPPRLIDYELLTGEDGKRTVGFGWYAGVAGALESLCALAHALLDLGVSSPFLYTPRPHTHPSLASILATLRDVVGAQIISHGTPKALGPIVFGVTGTGQVARGVLALLEDLPICYVKVQDLPALVNDPATDLHKIYVVHALPGDYFVRRDGQPYDRTHYYANPHEYTSEFHTRVAPFLTLLLNGAGWAPSYPRLISNDQLTIALERAQQVGRGRFACVGDISCDVEGGLEFLPRASTLSSPFFSTRPASLPAHLPSVTMMSVDILPTALPLESSEHFSKVLLPYLKTLIQSYRIGNNAIVDPEEKKRADALDRATVARDGALVGNHQWLEKPLSVWKESVRAVSDTSDSKSGPPGKHRRKKVLVLGSGMVAGPTVDEICRWGDTELVVASNILSDAQRLTRMHDNATPVEVDVADQSKVGSLIEQADVVISLLPVPFHPRIAELCIKHRKHMVTASYISPAMKALHERALSSNVLLLNEIGLDPGIDHCSAISLLNEIRAQKKEVVSFTSFCGGLPAPDVVLENNVPLKYKFSWSPRGVLSAALNGARFKLWNQVEEIPGEIILRDHFPSLPVSDVLKLEGIANRDSIPYAGTYDLGSVDRLRSLVRGTVRYQGFSTLLHSLKRLGLLETENLIHPTNWSDVLRQAVELRLKSSVSNDSASILAALSDLLPSVKDDSMHDLLESLTWFGIVPPNFYPAASSQAISSNTSDFPTLPTKPSAPIDLFATLLAHKLRYLPNERDMVILSHEIVARSPNISPSSPNEPIEEEIHTSTLLTTGTEKQTSMSLTVGLPVAFATRVVLDGQVTARGVCGPGVEKGVWRGVLDGLVSVGLGMKESVKVVRRRGGGGDVERSLVDARMKAEL